MLVSFLSSSAEDLALGFYCAEREIITPSAADLEAAIAEQSAADEALESAITVEVVKSTGWEDGYVARAMQYEVDETANLFFHHARHLSSDNMHYNMWSIDFLKKSNFNNPEFLSRIFNTAINNENEEYEYPLIHPLWKIRSAWSCNHLDVVIEAARARAAVRTLREQIESDEDFARSEAEEEAELKGQTEG